VTRPSTRLARSAVIAALLAVPAAWGCGYCVEDKVAASYDHAVVTNAIGKGQVVVFAEVSGEGGEAALVKTARRAAGQVKGIDRGSVRVTAVPATVSFALNPKARSPAEALAAAETAAGGRVKLRLLTVMR
jgi:hypothetical protein